MEPKITGRILNLNPYTFAGLITLLLLTIVVYAGVFTAGFVNWDDNVYITGNPLIADFSLLSAANLFGTTFDGHYHPLLLLLFMLEYHIGGANPLVFHTVNLLLHLFNVYLIFRLFLKISGKESIALITAALFAVHPVNVEAAAWACGQKDTLYAFFYLISLLWYIRYIHGGKIRNLLLSLVFALFSLFSKEQAVTLLPMVVLLDLWFKRRHSAKLYFEKLPFLLFALIFGFMAIYAQHQTGYIRPFDGSTVGLISRIIFGSYGLVMYLSKLVFPYPLCAYYPYPFPALGQPPLVYWIFPAALILLILLVFVFRRKRYVWFGMLFFLINIILMVRLFHANPGDYIIADRYQYIPAAGVFFIFGCISAGLFKRIFRKPGLPLFVAWLLILIVLSGLAQRRVLVWNNSLSLLNNTLDVNPDCFTALNCRGDIFTDLGRYPEALTDLNRAIGINDKNERGFLNRSRLKMRMGDINGALTDINKAIQIDPNRAASWFNRGLIFMQQRQYSQALIDYNTALKIDPGFTEAQLQVGMVHNSMHNPVVAKMYFDRVILAAPDNARAYAGRGESSCLLGNFRSAIEDFNQAVKLGYEKPDIRFRAGVANYQMGQFPEALIWLNKCLDLDPGYLSARLYRGYVYYNLNRFSDAANEISEYLAVNPSDPVALAVRGMCFYRTGNSGRACEDLAKAEALGNIAAGEQRKRICR